jgi:phage/plasmid-like protein (TIGR03299 family)
MSMEGRTIMSNESMLDLNTNTLIGFTEKRGTAWHWRANLQGAEPNHYTGPVPVPDVERRLFRWDAVTADVQAVTLGNDGVNVIPDPSRKAIIRPDTNTILGIAGQGYAIHQYRQWLLENLVRLLDEGLHIGSAGLLGAGRIAWVQLEEPDNMLTKTGVAFRPHLLACTSHDQSFASTYKRVQTVVVCDNTLALARGERGTQVKVRHTRNSNLNIATARDALQIVFDSGEEFAAEVDRLVDTEVSDAQWASFLDAHLPLPERDGRSKTITSAKREGLEKLWNYDVRVAPWKNTAFGVLQATNTYNQHEANLRGSTRPERTMLRAIDGTTDRTDSDALVTLRRVLTATR